MDLSNQRISGKLRIIFCLILFVLLCFVVNMSKTGFQKETLENNANVLGFMRKYEPNRTSTTNIKNFYAHFQNLLQTDPPKYLSNFKNPCWNESDGEEGFKVRCLPYFYLAGIPKCGTTDLFFELRKHPTVVHPVTSHWWTRRRFEGKTDLKDYINFFADASTEIESSVDKHGFHHLITGDRGVSYLWDIRHLIYPENFNATEPRVLLPHELHHITPQAKIIVIVRNPTARLYSAYLFFAKDKSKSSPELFHKNVKEDLNKWKNCLREASERWCAYNSRLKLKTRLFLGIDVIFIEDWLKVFPREQMHILRLEDYANDKEHALFAIYQFLGVGPLSSDTNVVNQNGTKNARKKSNASVGPMLPETKELLDDFYRPYNTRLANLLNDKRYLWSSP